MRDFFIRNSKFFILLLLAVPVAGANDLSVDRHTLRVGETVTITVSLEDAFATVDDVNLPVRNLSISATPSVSSEFSWINGTAMRRKVFRFAARAVAPGPAQVGPLVITLPDGEREKFAAVALQVMPMGGAASNDPVTVLRDLLSTERDPFFVIAEADKTQAFVGEEVTVTWWLYNGATVDQWQIGSVPKLADFWVEEVDFRNAQPSQAYVGNVMMQRMPIRRVALFPLRNGAFKIGSMLVEAKLMRRMLTGPSDEWTLIDTSFASAPLSLEVRPLPAAASGAVVGDLTLSCSRPRQRNAGPVLIDVTLRGYGNVRSARAPRFAASPEADVQLVERGASVDRTTVLPSLTRRWQYILFPARPGALTIPELTLQNFSPSSASAGLLRCAATTLTVTAADSSEPSTSSRATSLSLDLAAMGLAAVAAALLAIAILRVLRKRRQASQNIRQLVGDRLPAGIRDAVHDRLLQNGIDIKLLMNEQSDRGDAYRALRSLLDALEHDRMSAGPAEVRRRVRELFECVGDADESSVQARAERSLPVERRRG